MTHYHVTWQVDVEAANVREAAERARGEQRNPASHATAFDVTDPHDGAVTRVTLSRYNHDAKLAAMTGDDLVRRYKQGGHLVYGPVWSELRSRGYSARELDTMVENP